MNRKFQKIILTLLLCVYASDALLILYTYLDHPDVEPQQLIKAKNWMCCINIAALASCFVLAALIHWVLGLKSRYVNWDLRCRQGKHPWIIQLCQVLMTIPIFVIILSLTYLGVKYDHGQWMAGGGKGQTWHVVSQQQAVMYLWQGLRIYLAFFGFLSMAFALVAISLIRFKKTEDFSIARDRTIARLK